MSFNQFIGGLNAGQSAKQNRMIAKEQQGLLAQKSGMLQKQSGYLDEAVNAAETQDYGAGSVKAAAGGNSELAAQLQRLDEGQKSEAKEKLQRAGKIAAALSSLPPDQQVIGIKTYGEEFGLKPEDIEQALANPSVALAKFSSEVRDIEKMIEQSIPEVRTEGDQLINIQTGAGGVANTSELMKRDQTYDEIETNRSNVAGEQLAQDELGATQFANQTDRIEANTEQYKAENPTAKREKAFPDALAQAAVFGDRATNSNQEIETLISNGFNPSAIRRGGAIAGQPARQYDRSKREFINAVLRKESGAAIGKSEFENADKQYFPQFGDSPETMAQKKAARDRAASGLIRQSQGAYESLYGGNQTAPNQSAGGVPVAPPSGFVIDGQ